ncbi:MAG: alpha amylase N-terminal ig-like domain-containing protein [Candidatus Eisenbacteria sp.]|nr:alpha amylase N-terminal ig-like domain-containing protein [Candidatus Eisenbacteria bacterium]
MQSFDIARRSWGLTSTKPPRGRAARGATSISAGLLTVALVAWVLTPASPAHADEVTFIFEPPQTASSVFLAGSFNGWSSTQDRMSDADGDGVYELTLDLAPGRYEYKFVADGNWQTDESAQEFSDDGFGGRNAIVWAGEKPADAAPPPITQPTSTATGAGVAVTFSHRPSGSPQNIYLAGTFNAWAADRDRMTDADGDGTFELTLELAPGRYEYKFVVDGNWTTDMKAGAFGPDGFGGQNSVVVVGEGGVIPAAGAGAGAAAGAEEPEGPPAEGLFQVTFSHRPGATPGNIVLAGTFNDWSTTATPMSDANGDGTYETTLILPGGTYQYKFVIDGNWTPDPQATRTADDGFGGQNSVIRVDGRFDKIDLAVGDGKISTKGIVHSQTIAERNMLSDSEVVFRTRAYRGDIEALELAWSSNGDWTRIPMHSLTHDAAFDYYEGRITADGPLPALEYAFIYQDGDRELWLTPAGFGEPGGAVRGFELDPATVERIHAPEWVRDGIFYQIFPERFANGERSNDPDFKEWYYEGHTRLPRVGTFDGEYYHLIKDWYDVAGLSKSPYRSDGKPDWFSFYGGDIQGVMENLPYLRDLGITIIYFNPIFAARSSHKYDAADYRKVDPHFGGNEVFTRFVERAHEEGIRIVVDVVFNHCGDTHWAFQDCVKNGPDSEYWHWFEWKRWPLPDPTPPDYKPDQYYACWWGFGSLPDFNLDLSRPNPDENAIRDIAQAQPNMDVVDYLLETTRFWLETFDVDGFRLDVPNECPPWFWKLFVEEVRKTKPDAYIVAELWGDASAEIGPEMYDATMNYRYFRDPVLEWIARGQGTAHDFDLALAPGRSVYAPQSQQVMMNLMGSHDTERVLTVAAGDTRRLKLAALFQMTYVGTPHIYYGDEIAMAGGGDPDCRRPFYWKWEKEDPRRDVHDHYRKLIALRQELPALRRGAFQTLLAQGQIYAYLRTYRDEPVLVVMNNSARAVETEISLADAPWMDPQVTFVDQLDGTVLRTARDALRVPLGPFMGRILKVEE